jgi:hypothetical protein
MKQRLTMFMISLFLFAGSALAQTKVSGTVFSQEDGQPIIGAAVKVVGTATGMLTDVNGKFNITLPARDFLSRLCFSDCECQERHAHLHEG